MDCHCSTITAKVKIMITNFESPITVALERLLLVFLELSASLGPRGRTSHFNHTMTSQTIFVMQINPILHHTIRHLLRFALHLCDRL